jgi:DNA-binding NarL/FixJ family response regulator
MPPIQVLIVDDHPLYRSGVQAALTGPEDVRVTAAVGSCAEALAACREACPDLVLLDVNLPDGNGIEAAARILRDCPGCGVVLLTAYDDDAYVLAAAEAGAKGYLLKSATDAEILAAVRTVAAGASAFSPAVTLALLRRARGETARPDFGLTEREREVLGEAAAGRTNREIARRLGISERTVQAHLSHIYDKLDAASRTEAVTLALKHRLIALEDAAG